MSGFNIFNPALSFFLFQGFNFTPLAIASSGSSFTSSSPFNDVISSKLSLSKSRIQELTFLVHLEHLSFSSNFLNVYYTETYTGLKVYNIT